MSGGGAVRQVSADAPLGVFDSGLGGLTVAAALRRALPRERIVYLGDTARVPYGTRSAETVVRYARGCARLLLDRGVKALVIACNTVSAVAVDILRAELDLPVLGVVEPGARAALAALATQKGNGPVGVLGTAGTVASGAYPRAVSQLSTRVEVVAQAAPLLVPLVEEGWLTGDVPRLAVRRYVEPLVAANVSVIVLGCTHYPLLKHTIAEVAAELSGRAIPVVDSAEATAAAVQAWIDDEKIAPAGSLPAAERALELLVTDLPKSFANMAEQMLGSGAPAVTQVDLTA
ncbi:MAG TPA: glutamate racemase [Polyangiaceae bacterium]|nr:glutamate racemase [Polyangiaceae bacterium]